MKGDGRAFKGLSWADDVMIQTGGWSRQYGPTETISAFCSLQLRVQQVGRIRPPLSRQMVVPKNRFRSRILAAWLDHSDD